LWSKFKNLQFLDKRQHTRMVSLKQLLLLSALLLLVFAADVAVEENWREASAAKLGYSLESLLGLPTDEFDALKNLLRFCAEEDNCHLLEVAVKEYPLVLVNRRGRLLAGLPDKHNWANGETHRCANEGGWCHCTGNTVYTKKCKGSFSCNQANWQEVVSERWNSNHRSNVNGKIKCDNGSFGGDPWPGHDKQCFCHPKQEVPTAPVTAPAPFTQSKCYSECGRPGSSWWSGDWVKGFWCGASCTGFCPIQVAAFIAGREHVFPTGCAHTCYCVVKGWTA